MAYHGQRRLRRAQFEGYALDFFRSISVVRSDNAQAPLSAGAEALASPLKKWSAQLSYYATMTEMARRHKRSARSFLRPRIGAAANCFRGAS
jgi:hypothetical protein